jgi:lipoprotein-anchoring transpeptidase ErfK/SrfK
MRCKFGPAAAAAMMVFAAFPAQAQPRGGLIGFLFEDEQPTVARRYSRDTRPLYPRGQYEQQSRYIVAPSYEAYPVDPYQSQPRYRRMQPDYQQVEPSQRAIDPQYEKQMVAYPGREKAGTIVVDTPNKFLYLVQGDGRALRYGIGVGRPGFTWSGVKTVTAKKEWPSWTPPKEMLARRPDLPRFMEGGPENPLGARAMYLGSTLYRIHGSNEPWTIGTNVSSGCIRMRNEDVIDLYGRVGVGARVVVI